MANNSTLKQRINEFKQFHDIPENKDFDHPFEIAENGRLSVIINGKTPVILTKKNGSFYPKSTLRRNHKAVFMHALFDNLKTIVVTKESDFYDDLDGVLEELFRTKQYDFYDDDEGILENLFKEEVPEMHTIVLNFNMVDKGRHFIEIKRDSIDLTPSEAIYFAKALQKPTDPTLPIAQIKS